MYDERRDPVSLVTGELHATKPEKYDYQGPTKDAKRPDGTVILFGDAYVLKHFFRSNRFDLRSWVERANAPTTSATTYLLQAGACIDQDLAFRLLS